MYEPAVAAEGSSCSRGMATRLRSSSQRLEEHTAGREQLDALPRFVGMRRYRESADDIQHRDM